MSLKQNDQFMETAQEVIETQRELIRNLEDENADLRDEIKRLKGDFQAHLEKEINDDLEYFGSKPKRW